MAHKCVYLIVEDDHDKHSEQHWLHQQDYVMSTERERYGQMSSQLNSINVIKFRGYMLTPTLTLSGACLVSPRPLSLHRFPSHSLFATPRLTLPISRSKDWPYLHPEWTNDVKSMQLRKQSSEFFKSYWFWMCALVCSHQCRKETEWNTFGLTLQHSCWS